MAYIYSAPAWAIVNYLNRKISKTDYIVLRNEFFDQWHGKEDALQGQQRQAEAGYLASYASDFTQRVVWAGESVDLVRDIPAAADVIERIVDEAVAVLRSGAALVRGS